MFVAVVCRAQFPKPCQITLCQEYWEEFLHVRYTFPSLVHSEHWAKFHKIRYVFWHLCIQSIGKNFTRWELLFWARTTQRTSQRMFNLAIDKLHFHYKRHGIMLTEGISTEITLNQLKDGIGSKIEFLQEMGPNHAQRLHLHCKQHWIRLTDWISAGHGIESCSQTEFQQDTASNHAQRLNVEEAQMTFSPNEISTNMTLQLNMCTHKRCLVEHSWLTTPGAEKTTRIRMLATTLVKLVNLSHCLSHKSVLQRICLLQLCFQHHGT